MIRTLRPAVLAAAALCWGALASAGPGAAGGPEWRGWNEGLQEARATKRPVIVDVYTNWCGWCRRMDRDVYQRADIVDYLRKQYVTIKLNAESSEPATYEGRATTSQKIAQRFRVSGYPTTLFLRSSGEHMANVPGYVPGDKFLLLLRYVAEGHADRNVPFADFEKRVQNESKPR